MINLLPLEEKRQLRAARTNGLLIRYNVALVCAVSFLGLAMAVVYFYLNTSKVGAEQTIFDNKTKASRFATVEAEAQAFRSNLSVAKQILDNEVAYSKVILALAALMPGGTVLEKLNLDSGTFGTPTALTARAKTYENAIALKDSFQKPPLFSDVHFQSIASSEQASAYPYTVTLLVTFKKEAAKQ